MQRKSDGRPSPQALLARIEHGGPKGRGHLKLFLGYAAGVGKTYAMLQAAHRELSRGREVLVGVIETHQRPETAALLHGLELLDRKHVVHRDVELDEFDLDACLQRCPNLVLVDELAHTNSPGSRHAKRYQDVEELLAAGIDVYSTLNIQHLESLNDVVLQITGVRVRETLPDSVLEKADALALVDLPPEELLTRLQRGDVYRGTKAEAAARNFFRPGNLTALRELALRRAADRVDDDVMNYMKRRSIAGPWPVTDRLLVAVGPSPLSERLVRAARRLAEALSAEWWAVSVRGATPLAAGAEERVSRHLNLAESLGARTEVVSGLSIAEAVLEFAREHNVTKIVAGKPLQGNWFRNDLVDQLIRGSGDIDVFVVSGQGEVTPAPPVPSSPWPWARYLQAVLAVVLVTALCFPISLALSPTNLVMLYLLVVSLVAYWLGRGPSALASALSVGLFDFCFVPPYYTFVVSDKQYVVTFLGLLAVALVISTLTARAREQAASARLREQETASLFALSRALSQALSESEIGREVADYASRQLKLKVHFLPTELQNYSFANERERAVAMWAMQNAQPAGRGTDTLTEAEVLCIPILSVEKRILLGGLLAPLQSALSPVQRRLLETYARQAALALERARLSASAQESDLLKATDKLQTALLNSISHDLRIPLVSISGALQELKSGAPLATEHREALLDNALSESDRLNRIVGNLLHMTRLESGVVKANLQPQEPSEVVEMTLNMLRRPARLHVELPADSPLIEVDFGLMQQVLANLVENALKFTPPELPVDIGLWVGGEQAELWVRDYGEGVPEAERELIFERFYRGRSDVSGSGLGLSICKGLVEAQGGTLRVEAANPGARFVISLKWAKEHE